jgi:predicted nucleic acid-binding protein
MIILDTNIVSEFMRRTTNKKVVSWLNHQPRLSLYFTTISIAEIEFGLRAMQNGKKLESLKSKFNQFLDFAFEGRILGFDRKSANRYFEIMAYRQEIGQPISCFDGQIASIAQANQCALATRNTKDFTNCGIKVLNPFD